MRRTVIGIFKSLEQAENALKEIADLGYGNNEISMVTKKHAPSDINHDHDSFLVRADDITLPAVGAVSAGGPLAGALVQEDKSLADALTYYGVDRENAIDLENYVSSGFVLALVETNNSKVNEVANILSGWGGHQVFKWSKSIDKPMRPWS